MHIKLGLPQTSLLSISSWKMSIVSPVLEALIYVDTLMRGIKKENSAAPGGTP